MFACGISRPTLPEISGGLDNYSLRIQGLRRFRVSYSLTQPCRQAALTRSRRASCDCRGVIPAQRQRCLELGVAHPRALEPHRSRRDCHRPGQPAAPGTRRHRPRRGGRAPDAVANVSEDHLAAARGAAAADGEHPARVRPGRRALGVAGSAGIRRVAGGALARGANRRCISNGRPRIRAELRHGRCGAGSLDVVPASAPARRPHAGAVVVGNGITRRTGYSAGALLGAGRRHRELRPVGTGRRAAADVVTRRQADRRLCRQVSAGEACRAACGAGR